MECRITSTKRRHASAYSLIEMVLAGAIGSIVIGGLIAVQLFGNFSFASLYNYVDLSNQSHVALDKMTKNIRQASAMSSYTTNSVAFTNAVAGTTLSYTFNPTARTLVEVNAGQTNTLLKGCDSMTFYMYQRNPIQGSFDEVAATNAAQCKLLQVVWTCSRNLWANQTNETELMESAKIVIRN